MARDWGRGHHSAILSAELLDAEGLPTEFYEPGKPFNLRIEVETTDIARAGGELHCVTPTTFPWDFIRRPYSRRPPFPAGDATSAR